MVEYAEEDVGNIALLEHVNLQVPDQARAMLFYVGGLGLTRDPYLNVGLRNMWVNAGEQQFHLPTRPAQRIHGHIALVVPDLEALAARLANVEPELSGTAFAWKIEGEGVVATCPWGNQFRCYAPAERFGDMALGIPYVEFLVAPGTAAALAAFYAEVLGAPAELEPSETLARVAVGRNQALYFRETSEPLIPYDGHHIAIYVARFSAPYGWLKQRGLISEDVRNHQFRFKELVNPEDGAAVFSLEHEVRSLHHPMFRRPFVNRDATQSQRDYRRGRDALTPFVNGR